MSSTFWRDVRKFHHLLNLAHDGILTATELTITFPKVLEGTFGKRGMQLSSQQYREALESYLNRLYTEAYPDYFMKKLNRPIKQIVDNGSLDQLPADPRSTRNELPLLLSHFEKDFISGLSKEEEAVLHVDLQHSITTLESYYEAINRAVNDKLDKFIPVFIRGLTNTGYLSAPDQGDKIIDLHVHLEQDTIPIETRTSIDEQDPNNFEKVIKLHTQHITIAKIRLLFVALASFLYDSPKTKAIIRSSQEEPLKSIFDRIPNLLQNEHIIQPTTTIDDSQFMFQQLMQQQQMMVGMTQQTNNNNNNNNNVHDLTTTSTSTTSPDDQITFKFAGDDKSKIVTKPSQQQQQHQQQSSSSSQLNPFGINNKPTSTAPMSSTIINTIWKYMIYALSFEPHLNYLIQNPGQVYNPLIDDSIEHITEDDCNNPKKSEKERQVLTQIRHDQLALSAKSRQSKELIIIQSFSLRSLLNMIFRTYSHTLDITKSIVAINDYIGEVTYGDENNDDDDNLSLEEQALLSMMFAGGPMPSLSSSSSSTNKNDSDSKDNNNNNNNNNTNKNDPQIKLEPTIGVTANIDETIKLMNSEWLPPIRTSMDWAHAFTISQIVPIGTGQSSRQMMLLGKLGQGNLNAKDAARYQASVEEENLVDSYESYSLTDHIRAGRQ